MHTVYYTGVFFLANRISLPCEFKEFFLFDKSNETHTQQNAEMKVNQVDYTISIDLSSYVSSLCINIEVHLSLRQVIS